MDINLEELLYRDDYTLIYLEEKEVAAIFDDGNIRRLPKRLSILTPLEIRLRLYTLKKSLIRTRRCFLDSPKKN